MLQKEFFVKVSGDMLFKPEFINWLVWLLKELHVRVVVCVGGGTQIKKEFKRRGWKEDNYGPMGRETQTNSEEYWVAREILEKNRNKLKDRLQKEGVRDIVIEIPMFMVGGVYRHVNGDNYLLAAYLGFDKLYIVTVKKRVDEKIQQFAHLPKIELKYF